MLDGRLSEPVTDHAVERLDPGRVLLVESLAALNPEVSSGLLSGLEAAGANLLAGAPPVPLPPGGLDRLMARLEAAGAERRSGPYS
jgi:hypothetical protein